MKDEKIELLNQLIRSLENKIRWARNREINSKTDVHKSYYQGIINCLTSSMIEIQHVAKGIELGEVSKTTTHPF